MGQDSIRKSNFHFDFWGLAHLSEGVRKLSGSIKKKVCNIKHSIGVCRSECGAGCVCVGVSVARVVCVSE